MECFKYRIFSRRQLSKLVKPGQEVPKARYFRCRITGEDKIQILNAADKQSALVAQGIVTLRLRPDAFAY